MDKLEFLRAVKGRKLDSIIHYEERSLKNLTSYEEVVARFVIKENLGRRAPMARQMRAELGVNDSAAGSLVKKGYLYGPNIVDIVKVFFTRNGTEWSADEPVRSIFINEIRRYKTHGNNSWRKRMQQTGTDTSHPRYFLASVLVEGLPAYWPVFYKNSSEVYLH